MHVGEEKLKMLPESTRIWIQRPLDCIRKKVFPVCVADNLHFFRLVITQTFLYMYV